MLSFLMDAFKTLKVTSYMEVIYLYSTGNYNQYFIVREKILKKYANIYITIIVVYI